MHQYTTERSCARAADQRRSIRAWVERAASFDKFLSLQFGSISLRVQEQCKEKVEAKYLNDKYEEGKITAGPGKLDQVPLLWVHQMSAR